MSDECINKLFIFIDKRFPEPEIRSSKKTFKKKSIERYISQEILLKLLDRIYNNPSDILYGFMIYYNMLLHDVEKKNYIKKDYYNTYIRVLSIMKKYVDEEEKV